jgi:integrase
MPIQKLDAMFVKLAYCPEGKSKIDYYDPTVAGFVLEVRASGSKSYGLRYRDANGRQRQYLVGNAADLSFDKAKREAQRVRSRVTVGEYPCEERKAKRAIPTVALLAERYLEHARSRKRSHDIDERYMRNHIVPRFGKLRITDVTQADVVAWLDAKVKEQGYAQATVNRLQVIFCLMYKLAKRWQVPGSEHNPLTGLSLPNPNNERERFLTQEEVQRLKTAVEASANTQLKHIVALLLLTGARKRELLEARWEHIDLERRTWTIPMSKSGKARRVPLSAAAVDELGAMPRWPGCPYVVPNPKTKKPYTSIFNAWDTARRLAGLPDVRVHDLRHSCASNLVNSGQSLYVVSRVLGHAQARTSERYAHLAQDTLVAAVDAGAAVANW